MTVGAAIEDAQLQACRSDFTRWNQLWSWTGDYSWVGQNPDIASGPSNYCLSPEGGAAQKWNAPPTSVDSAFGGYREIAQ